VKGEDIVITEEQRKLDELTGKARVQDAQQGDITDESSRVTNMTQAASNKVKATGEQAKATLEQTKDAVVDSAQQLKDKVTSVGQDLKGRTQSVVEDGKSKVTSSLDGIASVLGRTTEELQSTELGQLAPYGERLQNLTQSFSDYLKDAKASDLLHDAEALARRQPALFLGGAFALGLIAARFLKSSSQNYTNSQSYSESSYEAR
jgi:hypothetical protein